MESKDIRRWIRAGLWALAGSWLLTAWATLEPQPDQASDPEGWARFVSTGTYGFSHLWGGTAGTILAVLGAVALGCALAGTPGGRPALAGMVAAVAGTALLLVPAVISTFATPAIGKAYLAGNRDVMQLEFPATMDAAFLLGLLLAFVGNVLLGAALWRSRTLPRWVAALWIAGAVVFFILGVVVGRAVTGSSLPTQTAGAVLMAVGAGCMAWRLPPVNPKLADFQK